MHLIHVIAHDFQLNTFKKLLIKKNFSMPKISTGGVDINNWSKLNEQEKKNAHTKIGIFIIVIVIL